MKTVYFLILAFVSGCGCADVPPGEVGVVTHWSELQDWTYPPGFHMHETIGTDVVTLSTRTEILEMTGESKLALQSRDQLTVGMDVTVQFRLNGGCAPKMYEQFNTDHVNRVIVPAARAGVREAAAEFNAVNMITQREAMTRQMLSRVTQRVHHTLTESGVNGYCLNIVDVVARDIDLPDSIQASIASVQQQRQRAQERELAIQTERQESERARIEAQRRADVVLIQARAQAEANRLIEQSLTPSVLQVRRLETMRALLESDQTRTIVVPSSNTGLFLNVE